MYVICQRLGDGYNRNKLVEFRWKYRPTWYRHRRMSLILMLRSYERYLLGGNARLCSSRCQWTTQARVYSIRYAFTPCETLFEAYKARLDSPLPPNFFISLLGCVCQPKYSLPSHPFWLQRDGYTQWGVSVFHVGVSVWRLCVVCCCGSQKTNID